MSSHLSHLAIFRGLMAHRPYCVKYNHHVKHANTRGSGDISPGKFENRGSEIDFGAISVSS